MTPRRRRLVWAAAAALLAAPLVALAASAADGTASDSSEGGTSERDKRADGTAPKIVSVSVAPAGVVKAASSKGTATFTITARVTDAGGVDTVFAGLYDPAKSLPDGRTVALTRTAGTAEAGTWTKKVTTKKADPLGTWDVRAFASDTEGNVSDPDAVYARFALQDPVRISSFDMGPEPVVGKVLGMSGKLQRYSGGKWVSYSGKYVTLEFRATGAPAFVPAGRWKSRSEGKFGAEDAVKPAATGMWRVTYAGNDHRSAAVSREDSVTVP